MAEEKLNVGILGVGAVGGFLAALSYVKGIDVTCIVSPDRAEALKKNGIAYRTKLFGEGVAHPNVVSELARALDRVIVTVKAPYLSAALKRISILKEPSHVISLLNGVGHAKRLRSETKTSVIIGTVGNLETYLDADGIVVSESARPVIELSGSPEMLQSDVSFFEKIGISTLVFPSEAEVVWRKLSRLAPLAAVTAASQMTLGEIRADTLWMNRLDACIRECGNVASANGVAVDAAAIRAHIDSLPPDFRTSLARDVIKKIEGELDSIIGGVIEDGKLNEVTTVAMQELYDIIRASLGPQ